ncbi:hypothetical protein BHE74_00032875 [Ensete ventricosum]|nr:hypothetical protein BHE74_00032875 [Ensete ventricosum]
MALNSWCYIIAFLGECQEAGIVPTHNLFMACFRLCNGHGDYYLTIQSGFPVSGAPSNNKGWKTRYLFISNSWGWVFRPEWSTRTINNVPPCLSDEEFKLVGRLNGILSSSHAIRGMIEVWLVEAGLSPALKIWQITVVLLCFTLSEAPADVTKKHLAEGEVTCPKKRTKSGTQKQSQRLPVRERVTHGHTTPEGRSQSGRLGAKPPLEDPSA